MCIIITTFNTTVLYDRGEVQPSIFQPLHFYAFFFSCKHAYALLSNRTCYGKNTQMCPHLFPRSIAPGLFSHPRTNSMRVHLIYPYLRREHEFVARANKRSSPFIDPARIKVRVRCFAVNVKIGMYMRRYYIIYLQLVQMRRRVVYTVM